MEQSLLDRRVQALVKTNPSLAEAAALQSALLGCIYGVSAPTRPIVLPAQRARDKLEAGTPLLHGEDVYLDDGFIRDVFGRLVNLLRTRPESAEGVAVVAVAARDHRLHVEHVVAEAFVNHADHVEQVAIQADIDADLLQTLAQLSARPILMAYAEHLATPLAAATWSRGYCPLCGAWPILAELRGPELSRHLRCGRCGSDWTASRLYCPFCGIDDHDSLGYLQIEGERRFRVDVCHRCQGYLKAGNAFDPSPPEMLALDDLASVHLDLAALERGHARPPEPGFRLDLVGDEGELYDD
ncbi:MAG: formate dehydrogenase accessory protein FdhE [Solirubrobacterales bacterium]|nr:formate dehydrogenase accessory protein FdhE [Solirubrobacterales bacterium]